jgi:transposase InsO family protein
MRFEFIAAEKASFPVSVLCRVMKVRVSGFYASLKRPHSRRKDEELKLRAHIRASHEASRKTYGSPRVHKDLKAEGLKVGRKRVARIMRTEGLRGDPPKKFRRTTDSKHDKPVAPNLLDRNLDTASEPNRVWVADITYVWTAMGWLYLAVIIDVFSRRVVGHAIADHMRTELVSEALQVAMASRDVSDRLIHHSDRGSQYASDDYRERLTSRGIKLSMSRKGNCWDNAVAESFFATLKKELVHRQYWLTKKQAILSIKDYILEFYNRRRRHSSIGFMSPADYERLTLVAKAA